MNMLRTPGFRESVEAVADALYREGTLSGDRIKAVIEDCRRDRAERWAEEKQRKGVFDVSG